MIEVLGSGTVADDVTPTDDVIERRFCRFSRVFCCICPIYSYTLEISRSNGALSLHTRSESHEATSRNRERGLESIKMRERERLKI